MKKWGTVMNKNLSHPGKSNGNYKDGQTLRKHFCRVCHQQEISYVTAYFGKGMCRSCGGKLTSHHLEGFHWCKDLRFDITNGIPLCLKCHAKFHFIYTSFYNTAEQFLEFINER